MIINDIKYDKDKIAGMIDQTLLAPDATEKMIIDLCATVKRFKFRSACTNSFWAPLVARELKGTGIESCFVVGFPFGAISTSSKVFEASETLKSLNGAPAAIDMVTNIGLLKDKNYKAYTKDIAAVVNAGESSSGGIKAILETALLTEDEIKAACECATEAGVKFVKTSTGRGGAPLIKDVIIMRQTCPENIGVKFSGYGNCNPLQLAIMGIAAGANRLGSPIGPSIIEEMDRYYEKLTVR